MKKQHIWEAFHDFEPLSSNLLCLYVLHDAFICYGFVRLISRCITVSVYAQGTCRILDYRNLRVEESRAKAMKPPRWGDTSGKTHALSWDRI